MTLEAKPKTRGLLNGGTLTMTDGLWFPDVPTETHGGEPQLAGSVPHETTGATGKFSLFPATPHVVVVAQATALLELQSLE